MVGSSRKTLESKGEALIRSPAPTKSEASRVPPCARNAARADCTVVATLADPPTVVVTSSAVP